MLTVVDVCNSRYNDREYLSIRIKNWASCIPEELRQTEYMSVVPYDRQLEPVQIRSPFLRGVRNVPGFLAEPKRQPGAEDDEDYDLSPNARPRRDTRSSNMPEAMTRGPEPHVASSSMSTPVQRPPYAPPQQPTRPPMAQTPGPGPAMPPTHPGIGPSAPSVGMSNAKSIAAAMGGAQAAHNVALVETLPIETGQYRSELCPGVELTRCPARLFERDQQRQVLWFSGPPLPVGAVKVPEQPTHSLEYLTYLAKRKRGEQAKDARQKLPRRTSPAPRSQESSDAVELNLEDLKSEDGQSPIAEEWWAEGLTQSQIVASLKATAAAHM